MKGDCGEAIDGKSTRIVDRVTYRLPWGPIGWMGDWLVVRRRIREMFAYQRSILREILRASVDLG
ncbi:MAG: hypothetical protein NTU53_17795 [Planctomycetota bacterium]|nr:hypothetical protein [Planctomycetota bacterium]